MLRSKQDVFIEFSIISEWSVKGVLTGKHYNRSVFCHKILYEAMQRLRFDAFFDQLDEVKQERFHGELSNSFPERSHEYTENPVMEEIHNQYQDYILESSRRSRTFSFWIGVLILAGTGSELHRYAMNQLSCIVLIYSYLQ